MISPCAEDRQMIRAMHDEAGLPFVEVFLDTPIEECERRDPKGLYARARAGQLPGFTGIDSDYEVPSNAELVLRPSSGSITEQIGLVLDLVRAVLG
jgi:bifunctional enzyme CysN/CysC